MAQGWRLSTEAFKSTDGLCEDDRVSEKESMTRARTVDTRGLQVIQAITYRTVRIASNTVSVRVTSPCAAVMRSASPASEPT